jgi:hypothetical protein
MVMRPSTRQARLRGQRCDQRRRVGDRDAALGGLAGDVDRDQDRLHRAGGHALAQLDAELARVDRVDQRHLAGDLPRLVALQPADEVPARRACAAACLARSSCT